METGEKEVHEGLNFEDLRNRLTPGFHFGVLKEAIPFMSEEGRRFVEEMKVLEGKPIEAKRIFTNVTLRVIIKTAFGGDFDPTWMAVKIFLLIF